MSWYGKYGKIERNKGFSKFDYRDRGFRITLVKITDLENLDAMDEVEYRHILFVDQDGQGFYDCHAGGIAYKDGLLYVADSRGTNDQILTFAIDEIEQVNPGNYFNYGYIIRAKDYTRRSGHLRSKRKIKSG